ncbi:MAG: CbiX/SirB N-terminal domain-containing protein [Burkholderiaceae bacterium]
MQRGLILFAHGARDPRWSRPFEDVARSVRERDPQLMVQLAFLEFMTPGLVDAGHAMAQAGCARVDVVPLFLGTGGHVRKDLPLLIDQLTGLHPRISWQLRGAIGEVDSVIDAMAKAALALTIDEAPAA